MRYYDYRDDIMKLNRRARRGNISAMKELEKLNRDLSSEANRRLRLLEKRGRDYYAYDIATQFTQSAYGTSRYNTRRKQTQAEIFKNAMSAAKFLQSESSTLSGQQRIEKSRYEALLKNPRINLKGISRKKLSQFMQTELFKEYVSFNSEDAFNLAEEALYKNKASLEELEEAWNEYERGETDLFGVWESWAGIDPFA